MELSGDELAGVVDLFGALTRAELVGAVDELAFKRGADADPEAVAATVDEALAVYRLVAVDRPAADTDDPSPAPLLVAGPTAFPTLPEGAEDLPHIMDVPEREVDRERAAEAASERFRADAATAIDDADDDRIAELVDVSYDLTAWGPVDGAALRDHLDGA